MGDVFIDSEAIAAAALNDYQLRRWYRTIFRDVYVPKWGETSLDDRTVGAWLWSRRRGVIAGAAASALHGAQWVDADTSVELVAKSARPQCGLIVRNETLGADEVTQVTRRSVTLPVTSVARTAFDLGRHLPRGQALARLDALMRATPFSFEDVSVLAKRYRAREVCDDSGTCCSSQMVALHRRRKAGCGCFSSTLVCRNQPRRYRFTLACDLWVCWTWAGRTTWSLSSMTVTNTAPTGGNSSKTSID